MGSLGKWPKCPPPGASQLPLPAQERKIPFQGLAKWGGMGCLWQGQGTLRGTV